MKGLLDGIMKKLAGKKTAMGIAGFIVTLIASKLDISDPEILEATQKGIALWIAWAIGDRINRKAKEQKEQVETVAKMPAIDVDDLRNRGLM